MMLPGVTSPRSQMLVILPGRILLGKTLATSKWHGGASDIPRSGGQPTGGGRVPNQRGSLRLVDFLGLGDFWIANHI